MATLSAAELRNLGRDELMEKLGDAKEELFNLRFQAATGQLESHGRLRAVRKEIARIYTVLTERALGITDDVDADIAAAEAAAAKSAESAESADEETVEAEAGSKA
jgi:large subunit ribosomal protein L29